MKNITKRIQNIFNTNYLSWLKSKKLKYRLLISPIVLAILVGMFLLLTRQTQAAWFDDSYAYRKSLTFVHNAALTNQSMRLTVSNTDTLVTNGKMQSDCDDTRFTDSTGKMLQFKLVSGCNSSSTVYDVVFPTVLNGTNLAFVYYGNPSARSASDSTVPAGTTPSGTVTIASEEKAPSPQAYYKFDEGYGTTANDSTANNNDASLEAGDAGTVGTAVNIDNASDFGIMNGAGRQVVRTSSGTLYAFINDGGSCEVWKSIGGSSWAEQDSANNPTCSTSPNVHEAVALDSSNNLHLIYLNAITGALLYRTFSTATDLFTGSEETIHTTSANINNVAIAIDTNDMPHVAFFTNNGGGPGTYKVLYDNRITNNTWKASSVELDSLSSASPTYTSIAINEDNIPEVSWIHVGAFDLTAAVGNQNDATSFTVTDVDTTVNVSAGTATSSLGVDSSGNTWIAYIEDTTNYVTLVKHNDSDAWSTWQTPITNSNVGNDPSLVINGSDIYILYEDENDDIKFDMYNGTTWYGETDLQTGTYQDVKARYSYINNYDNSGTAKVQTNTYYFDNSDNCAAGASCQDPNSVWTNDANAFDSSVATSATTSSIGSTASSFLKAEGTNASALSGTITSVKARVHGYAFDVIDNLEVLHAAIYTDGLGELLGTPTVSSTTAVWGSYATLSTPSGGWTWSKIQALETKLYATRTGADSISVAAFKVEVLVESTNSTSQTDIDFLFSDGTDVYYNSYTLPVDGGGGGGGTPTWKTSEYCISTNCLFFDGDDDVGTVTNANSIDMDKALASSLTFQTWVRINSDGEGNSGEILQKGTSTYLRVANEGSDGYADLQASLDLATADATVNVTNGLTLNKWHHVVMTYADDGDDEITIYIDGKLQTTSTNGDGAPTSDSNDLLIGGSSAANFHGFLDEFKIYDEERSAAQIKAEYLRITGLEGSATVLGESDSSYLSNGLVGYWKIDETSGNATDASGNGYTLTNNGTTTFVSGKFANGSEHVPASSQYFSTATTINGVKSVSFWVNPDSTNNYFISLTSTAYITSSGGTLSATGFTNPTIFVNGQQSTSISADTWQLITVTTDTAINADQLYLGRQGSNYFDGTIDDVRIYNRALTSSEVRSLFDWAPGAGLWWKFDDNSGTAPVDSSGNGVTGSFTGTPAWVSGKYAAALQFNGSAAVTATIADPGNLNSVEVWVYPTSSIASKTIVTASKLTTNGSSQPTYGTCTGNTIPLNQWTHIVAVSEGSSVCRIYQNGVLTASNTTGVSFGTSVNVAASSFIGTVDEVKVYNYAISAKQVIVDMNAGHPIVGTPVGSPVGHWSFDEGYGTTANDKSPHNNSLTLSTASWTNSGRFGKALNAANQAVVSYRNDDNDFDFSSTESFTLSTWMKSRVSTNPASIHYIVSKFGSAGYSLYANSSGQIVCGIDDNAASFPRDSASSTTDYYDTEWHHILCVLDRATGRLLLYIDGKIASNSTLSGTYSLENAFFLSVGGFEDTPNLDSFDGYVDETKIYRVALNADQVKTEYNQGKAQVFGAASTASNGIAPDNSASRIYCPPGNTEGRCGSGDPSPLGEWKLDEGTGTSTNNSGTSGTNNGTLTNSPLWVPGKFVSGLQFNNSSNFVSLGTSSTLPDSSGAHTISAWIYPNSVSTNVNVYCKGSGACLFTEATGVLKYCNDGVCANPVATSANAIRANVWQHVAMTYDGSSAYKLYVNGVDKTSDATGNEQNCAGCNIYIGFDGGSGYTDGKIDHVTVYDYVRTPAQIAWAYNRGGPIAHWKFDECQGTTAYDATGNGNNGTIAISSGSQSSAGTCNSGSSSEAWNNGASGKFNSSISLDADQDNVTVSDAPIFDITGDFTLSAWIQKTGGNSAQIISKTNGDASGGYGMLTGGAGEVYCRSSNGTTHADTWTATGLVSEGTGWHHVVAVRSGSTCRLYVDGIERSTSGDEHPTVSANALDVKIGATPSNTELFSGKIDDARIYNYALSTQQIKLLYNENAAVRFAPVTGAP